MPNLSQLKRERKSRVLIVCVFFMQWDIDVG